MPHKRNPITAERICGLARVVRANALVGLENVALWHERDISHSSAERIVLPDSFLAVDYMLDRFTWLIGGLVVRTERMRENLDASHGLVFSQRLLLALVESGLVRDEAYRLVQRHAMRAWDEGLDFHELVGHDTEVAGRVDLDRVFDPRRAHAPTRMLSSNGCVRSVPRKGGGIDRCLRRPCISAAARSGSSTRSTTNACCLSRPTGSRPSTWCFPTPIPDKGRVLTGLSAFWFARTEAIVPNHMLALRDDGRSLECRRLEMLPVEVVVRGYLTGSGWKDYTATGSVSGHVLPAGLRESERLPEPIVTPATKAVTGHDLNIDEEEAARICGEQRYAAARYAALELYRHGEAHAASRGIIVADTKFELGVDPAGNVVLADEALTPDSSRFWPADTYAPGKPQPSFDKQFVRDWCETTGWDKTDPGPELPADIVTGTRGRYVDAFEQLTEISFDDYLADPRVVTA